jgi:hypothetical protein
VIAITAQGDPNCAVAELNPETSLTFESGQPFLKIKGQNTVQRLFKHDFDISELGIGGLDKQFAEIFRGAFASRAAPPHIAKLMNIQHTKGILLYGPPGTGGSSLCTFVAALCSLRYQFAVNWLSSSAHGPDKPVIDGVNSRNVLCFVARLLIVRSCAQCQGCAHRQGNSSKVTAVVMTAIVYFMHSHAKGRCRGPLQGPGQRPCKAA